MRLVIGESYLHLLGARERLSTATPEIVNSVVDRPDMVVHCTEQLICLWLSK